MNARIAFSVAMMFSWWSVVVQAEVALQPDVGVADLGLAPVVVGACALALLVLGLLAAWFFSVLPLRARLRKAARNGGSNSTGPLKHIDD